MKHKTAELGGALLDAAVAEAVGFDTRNGVKHWAGPIPFQPSVDWLTGGPIIERERIVLFFESGGAMSECWVAGFELGIEEGTDWGGQTGCDAPTLSLVHSMTGPTPLVAAMRAYVISKLGDEVELP